MLRHPAHWLAPIIAVLVLLNWIISEIGRGPWPDLLWFMIPAAVLLAITPWMPVASLAIMVLLPAAQVIGLVIGPGSNTWPIYLVVPLAALILGGIAEGRSKRFTLVAGFIWAGLVAFLLAAPGPQGSWA